MEVRLQMIGEERMTHIEHSGFWIRSSASPAVVTRPRRILRGITNDKENIPSTWLVTPQGCARHNKSPLPVWYPRTPLGDITIIVNAVERKRMHARAARIQQQGHESGATPRPPLLTSSVSCEPSVSDHTPPNQALSSKISDTSSDLFGASSSSLSSSEHQPETFSPDDFLPYKSPSKPVVASTDSLVKVLRSDEYQTKLGSSIDEIEKVVMKNLKNTPRARLKKTTVTLMSMR